MKNNTQEKHYCVICGNDLTDAPEDTYDIIWDGEDSNDYECKDCPDDLYEAAQQLRTGGNPNFGKPFSKHPSHIYCGGGVTKHNANGKKWTTRN